MYKFPLSLSILSLITVLNCEGCIDPDDCPERFHIPAQVIPYQREYHIGDTITVVSKFHRYVHELKTDRKYDMNNMLWNPNGGIWYLDTIGYSKISDYFIIISNNNYHETVSSRGFSTMDGQYEFKLDTFSLEFKIIPKRNGNYSLELLSGIGPNHGDVDFPVKCRGKGYDVIVDMNSGKDGNIEILKLSKDSIYHTELFMNTTLYFYNKGGFCFSVVP